MFGQGVVCGDLPGAWKLYVATLTDVTEPDKPFVLASSNPVVCSMPVSFSWVIPGHKYVADVDGYEHGNLVSYGGFSSGSRHVIDPATGAEVKPRWQTSCGKESNEHEQAPTTSYLQTNMVVGACSRLEELEIGTTETGVAIDLSSARGNLSCGDGPGQVARYRVTPQDPSIGIAEANCDEVLTFAPLTASRAYTFLVEAFEAHGSDVSSPSWATSCEVRTLDGVVMPASCDLLSNQGALRIDIGAILSMVALSCSEDDVVSYRATVVGMTLTTGSRSCSSTSVFSGLQPASYQVLVDAFDSTGQERLNAFCEAVVQVGQTADAVCLARATE